MWSDVQESEPSASWLDLPENGWGALIGWAAGLDNLRRRPSSDAGRTITGYTERGGKQQPFEEPFTAADRQGIDDDIDRYLRDAGLPPRPRASRGVDPQASAPSSRWSRYVPAELPKAVLAARVVERPAARGFSSRPVFGSMTGMSTRRTTMLGEASGPGPIVPGPRRQPGRSCPRSSSTVSARPGTGCSRRSAGPCSCPCRRRAPAGSPGKHSGSPRRARGTSRHPSRRRHGHGGG